MLRRVPPRSITSCPRRRMCLQYQKFTVALGLAGWQAVGGIWNGYIMNGLVL